VCIVVDLEFIDILDNNQSYPTFLGFDWTFINQMIINLKKREIIFEGRGLKVTALLYPREERSYVEPVIKIIDNLYNMTVRMDDYVIATTDGVISWRSIVSCASYSEEGLEHWQCRLHEVLTRICALITQFFHWIETKVCDTPRIYGLT
jgi:hypothetical protein